MTRARALQFSTRAFMGLILMGLLSACSVDGQITDVTRRTYKPKMAESTGIISGANHQAITPEGYVVSSSVAAPVGGQTDLITPEGYSVHSNVQGNINSETFDIIIE